MPKEKDEKTIKELEIQHWRGRLEELRQKHRIIEPKIKVLVDALNATGLVKTVASCEGHLEETLEIMKIKESFSFRNKAYVCFEANKGIEESTLEELFRLIYLDHLDSMTKWEATLNIIKRYIACKEAVPIEYIYCFELEPFNPHEPLEERRKKLDILIKEVAESVQKNANTFRRVKE